MGCIEKYGIWESCRRLFQEKNYDGLDKGAAVLSGWIWDVIWREI